MNETHLEQTRKGLGCNSVLTIEFYGAWSRFLSLELVDSR